MVELRKTARYAAWLDGLGDLRARARIQMRIERLAAGHPGDARFVGDRVTELRIDHGPGYRVYFTRQGRQLIILLAGGDKSSQVMDIDVARRMARQLEAHDDA